MSDRNRMERLDTEAPVPNPYPPMSASLVRIRRLAHEELRRQEAAQRASERRVWRWVVPFLAVVAGVVVVVALSGCAKAVTFGTVTAKHYSAAYTSTVMVCAGWGKYGCMAWVPILDHHDPEWSLDLRQNNGDTGTVDVSRSTYRSISIGDYYQSGDGS